MNSTCLKFFLFPYLVFCDNFKGQRDAETCCVGNHIWTPGIHMFGQPVSEHTDVIPVIIWGGLYIDEKVRFQEIKLPPCKTGIHL